jgi:amino acid adenylation domain-containing protein
VNYLLHHLLDEAVAKFPDKIAITCKGDNITYAELGLRSGQLAYALMSDGLKAGDRVGIFLTKSIHSLVAMFAALKAGGVYVPIDPLVPPKRAAYILGNCGIKYLVSSSDKLENLLQEATSNLKHVYLSSEKAGDFLQRNDLVVTFGKDIDNYPELLSPVSRISTDLAYILYTSGSTGQPKGVMITHLAAFTFINWAHDEFNVSSTDVLANHAPLHFDLSVFDIYVSVKAGARLVLVPQQYSTFPVMLTKLIYEENITIWYSVPSALILMLTKGGFAKNEFTALRLILFAGEVFPIKYLRQLREAVQSRLCNLYGPTETNVCTFYDASQLENNRDIPVPIGKPINDYEIIVLKKDGSLAVENEEGELCARGPGLMSGYWGDEEKTNQLLVPNPLQKQYHEKIYRTGDLVKINNDGDFIYISRIDNMIKSRGYRIELGEIESTLYAQKNILEAAVIAIPDDDVTNRIIAYIVTSDKELMTNHVLKYCGERLPKYMVPEHLEIRDWLPKTSTGKIDKNCLKSEYKG